MNRKQRRAGLKQTSSAGGARGQAAQLFADALRAQQQNKLDEAARAYKRLLLLTPDHAQASNNLACVLQAQGKLAEASARFARTLELMPQLLGQFSDICATLVALLPPLGEAMRRANAAWPQRLPLDQSARRRRACRRIAADPLLLTILQSSPVRDIALERVLTTLRAVLLERAIADDDAALAFCCALAQQCFINEYVFATTPDEDAQVEQIKNNLRDVVADAARGARDVSAAARAAGRASSARTHMARRRRRGRDPATARAAAGTRAARFTIPQLTPIEDATSQRVRQMYEENPYPRWVHRRARGQRRFPSTTICAACFRPPPSTPLAKTEAVDVLVAGCGTGWHAIAAASEIPGRRLLAVDLSLTSLAYAKRKTPRTLAPHIDYAQADILKLGALDRRFDVDRCQRRAASHGRSVRRLAHAARAAAPERLHASRLLQRARTPRRVGGARLHRRARLRHDPRRDPPLPPGFACNAARAASTRFDDFFTTSECRDLLFHVQESRTTIPAIKAFLAEHGLKFIGFEFGDAALRGYRALFAEQRWSMSDLDRWHDFETKYPDTFSGMYQFWVQKM